MSWIVYVVFTVILLTAIGVGVGILHTQKILDIPYSGFLLVDRKEEDEPAMVYFQAMVDPKEYRDGETIKLKVRIVPSKHEASESQGKQG